MIALCNWRRQKWHRWQQLINCVSAVLYAYTLHVLYTRCSSDGVRGVEEWGEQGQCCMEWPAGDVHVWWWQRLLEATVRFTERYCVVGSKLRHQLITDYRTLGEHGGQALVAGWVSPVCNGDGASIWRSPSTNNCRNRRPFPRERRPLSPVRLCPFCLFSFQRRSPLE